MPFIVGKESTFNFHCCVVERDELSAGTKYATKLYFLYINVIPDNSFNSNIGMGYKIKHN